MSLGLVGAHRVGKTSLAREVAARKKITFLQTSTSDIFKKMGLNPAAPLTFHQRMMVQWAILEHYAEIYAKQTEFFITDRTPIDLLGYTFADVQGDTHADYPELARYMQECYKVANTYFNWFVVVQPGIPLVEEPGKAALNLSYMEHLNMLMIGFCYHPDQKARKGVMVREAVQMERRVISVCQIIDRLGEDLKREKQNSLIH
jgi:hypothetical protein